MGRLYSPGEGKETLHFTDLPSCCRRAARKDEGGFACPSCGAVWNEAKEEQTFREALLSSPEATEDQVRDWLGEAGVSEWRSRKAGK